MDMREARRRAAEIVGQMTAEEKMSQLKYNAPAIERLGINEHNWWNEALHGVARAGTATVFPQAIGLAATFDPELVRRVADVISTEARAKYNKSVEYGDRGIYKGLTFWSPNINIFRDPRWGRGQETYGEDPFLTAEMARAFIGGIQGDGEFLKAGACAKHMCAHSGPEALRHSFDAVVSQKELYETYLPAFERSVEAGVAGVMGAYNRVNGVPCCANEWMIEDVLRKKWGFDGYFVSDCWAINDIYQSHKYCGAAPEAAAAALNAGCDLNCGDCYEHLIEAYEMDTVTDERLTEACERLFAIRIMLGEFEEKRPYSDIGFEVVDCRRHREINLTTAEESIVLLKNDGILPLDPSSTGSIAVVGPNAVSVGALEGNYEGKASEYVTAADGIRREFPGSTVRVAQGCKYLEINDWDFNGNNNMLSDGMAAASVSDVTVLCLGLDPHLEGEEIDRADIMLPQAQRTLAQRVCEVCDNVIVVLMCGSSMDIGRELREKAKAIIWAGYPGALGGLAAARIISGSAAPGGRLPVTFYDGQTELPPFEDYSMSGRTYRFLDSRPLYPFGYGLGYGCVEYISAQKTFEDEKNIRIAVRLKNTGRDKTEKVQIYAEFSDSRTSTPKRQLCCVKAVRLAAGETADVECAVDKFWLKAVLSDGTRVEPDGGIQLFYAVPTALDDGGEMKMIKIGADE